MKLKKLLLGTALTAGTVFAIGTTSANADEIYTIQSDDTLAKISKQFVGDKSLVDSIVEANDIKDKNMIYIGEELTIPTDGDSEQAPVQQEAPAPAPEVQEQPEQQEPVEEQPEAQEQPVEEAQPAAEEEAPAPEAEASSDSSVEVNDHLKQIAQRESGGDTSAINPSSGAAGKYQFLQPTWDSVVSPEYQGTSPAEAPEEVQDA
ncbi:MAG: transglycosylase family protein, partial [Tetragenococcus koreensis]|nr:transglycosylase family protein [Tetragenococcus koreensis]